MTASEFWQHVDSSGGPDACWPWLASRNPSGYGWVRFGGRVQYAHRVAYQLANHVTLDSNTVVRHQCSNPPCCNPAHHLPGSHADNVADRCACGHTAAGERNGRAKLHARDVECMRCWWAHGLVTVGDLARRYGVSRKTVRLALRGETWCGLGRPCRTPGKVDGGAG